MRCGFTPMRPARAWWSRSVPSSQSSTSRTANETMRLFYLLLLAIGGLAAHAQSARPLEKVLLPIWFRGTVPGAFGASWSVRVIGYNASSQTVTVIKSPVLACNQGPCDRPNAPAQATFTPEPEPTAGTGAFLFIDRDRVDDIHLNLRIQDVSRQALTWGTEIPVVRARDVFTGPLLLLDVPTDARFRQSLRVYDFDDDIGREVRLRILSVESGQGGLPAPPDRLLVDTNLTLTSIRQLHAPGSAEIGWLVSTFPQLTSSERVRIELTPVTPGLRFWAFVSITNNETQHVTTITPR